MSTPSDGNAYALFYETRHRCNVEMDEIRAELSSRNTKGVDKIVR